MQDDIDDVFGDDSYDISVEYDRDAIYREEDAKRMAMHMRETSVRLAIDFCKTPSVNTYNVGDLLSVAASINDFINKTDQ